MTQAVNILRTAPHVCTMLIESCVAAPATPNGKPVMPGSESASAFYHPHRQQQMQPMIERQPSLESQYSSMQQQFVPSQSHQIEDIVTVSTTNVKEPNSETLSLGKRTTIEAIAWAQPFEGNTFAKGTVSAILRERAKSKVMALNENGSPEDSPEKCKGDVDLIDSLAGEGTKSPVNKTEENTREQSLAPLDDCQKLLPAENLSVEAESQPLPSVEEQTLPNEESGVVSGFFKKIHSFLFSPTSPKRKRSEESESSCCESDFDSEFSEMTQGSFNPGDIEAIRDELEQLLSGSPNQGLENRDGFSHGEGRSSQRGSPLPLTQEELTIDSKSQQGDKDAVERGKVEALEGLERTMTYKKLLESSETEQGGNEIINFKVEDDARDMQETERKNLVKSSMNINLEQKDTSFCKDVDCIDREISRVTDDKELEGIYKTNSVLKVQKETTV